MLCEGCEGDGTGDCSCTFCICAFAAGTAAASIAALRNGVHSRIIHPPIFLRIAAPPALKAILRGRPLGQVISSQSVPVEAKDSTYRKGYRIRTLELCS